MMRTDFIAFSMKGVRMKRMKKLALIVAVFYLCSIVIHIGAFAMPTESSGGSDNPSVTTLKISNNSELKAIRRQQEADAEGKQKPQMGWSTWNNFRQNIDEETIYGVAKAMADTGLVDAGYQYLNLDDCWQSSLRDSAGRLQFDAGTFPSKEGFVADINALGMKVGLYSSTSDLTCEDLPGSYGYEEIDAQTFADWGIEYLKYDYCHVVDLSTDMNGGMNFPTQTPPITYIGVNPVEGSDVAETRYPSSVATLAGNAVRSNGAVSGLDSNGGSMTFEVEVATSGTYSIAVGYNKSGSSYKKFAQAVVNNGKAYEVWFPRTSGWSGTARTHVEVTLEAGMNTIKILNPITGQKADSIIRYKRMGDALKEATAGSDKPIFFSICEHGRTNPWEWAQEFASSWRVGHDIQDSFTSVLYCYELANSYWSYQVPGAYNDPDMLEVGVKNLSATQNQSHFSLWCMMNSPLILACDTRNFISETAADGIDRTANKGSYEIITNSEIIALNQDPLLLQAKRVSIEGGIDVLVKPLENGEAAICFFNKSGAAGASTEIDLNEIRNLDERVTLERASVYGAKDLWNNDNSEYYIQTAMLNSGSLPKDGVAVYRVKNIDTDEPLKYVDLKLDSSGLSMVRSGEQIMLKAQIENLGEVSVSDAELTLTLPTGCTAAENVETNIGSIGVGETKEIVWNITMPDYLSTLDEPYRELRFSITADLLYEGETERTPLAKNIALKLASPIEEETYLSDVPWISSTTGWGTIKRNQSIDGNQLKLAGNTYNKGIGTHAKSTIEVFLGGESYNFHTVVGIDEEVQNANASVVFIVQADGREVYRSNVMGQNQSEEINLSLEGCRVLTLIADETSDGNSYDHADWADIKLTPKTAASKENIGLLATAHAPQESLANGKLPSYLNDNIFDDQAPGADGHGVFAMKKPLSSLIDADLNYFDLNWDSPVTIDSLKLWTYFGKSQGPASFEVYLSEDGTNWETIADKSSGAISWKTNAASREQEVKEIVFEEPRENIKGMRVKILSSNEVWGVSSVITEVQVFGN